VAERAPKMAFEPLAGGTHGASHHRHADALVGVLADPAHRSAHDRLVGEREAVGRTTHHHVDGRHERARGRDGLAAQPELHQCPSGMRSPLTCA
jgi:hypothetical protein